ncbi:MAG TPA: Rrf2 family transcriptional regulator [Myxococcota bacterium]|nr:Rrf2 family transcriptional regulator [Myxococcota bacterium]
MRLSRQVQYALCGLFDLAYNGAGEPVQVRAIGERQRIPHRFLEQIFARLRRAELVEGKRGPGGGYVLRRPPEAITLREVVEAVEGPLADRLLEGIADWPASPHRPDFLWPELARRMSSLLDGIAVADLCREAARSGIARDLPAGLDYQI